MHSYSQLACKNQNINVSFCCVWIYPLDKYQWQFVAAHYLGGSKFQKTGVETFNIPTNVVPSNAKEVLIYAVLHSEGGKGASRDQTLQIYTGCTLCEFLPHTVGSPCHQLGQHVAPHDS